MTAEAASEVLAVRYGTVQTSRAGTFYQYGQYGEPDAPLPMDYFFWLIRGPGATVLVDTGFAAEVGRRRGRTCLVDPVRALAGLGVVPGRPDRGAPARAGLLARRRPGRGGLRRPGRAGRDRLAGRPGPARPGPADRRRRRGGAGRRGPPGRRAYPRPAGD